MIQAIKNIYQLGKKEILSLCRDGLLMALIVYSFTAAIIARVAKNVIELAADIPLLFVLLPAALIAHRKTGGFKRKKTAEASGS